MCSFTASLVISTPEYTRGQVTPGIGNGEDACAFVTRILSLVGIVTDDERVGQLVVARDEWQLVAAPPQPLSYFRVPVYPVNCLP